MKSELQKRIEIEIMPLIHDHSINEARKRLDNIFLDKDMIIDV
jgi:hypothetical protein